MYVPGERRSFRLPGPRLAYLGLSAGNMASLSKRLHQFVAGEFSIQGRGRHTMFRGRANVINEQYHCFDDCGNDTERFDDLPRMNTKWLVRTLEQVTILILDIYTPREDTKLRKTIGYSECTYKHCWSSVDWPSVYFIH